MTPIDVHDQTPTSVLAIYAHPDDADVAAAGTLARWAKEGASITLVIMTDGGRGTPRSDLSPVRLAEQRREELEAACAITGVTPRCVGLGDGEIENTQELRADLVRLIRTERPQVIVSHDPTAVFFGEHYFNHHDHRALGWAVLDAAAPMAALPHYFSEAGDPHLVSEVLLSGTLEPNCVIDIASYIDAKISAVSCHRSQFDDDGSGQIAEVLRLRAIEDGRRGGLAMAEGFRRLRPNG